MIIIQDPNEINLNITTKKKLEEKNKKLKLKDGGLLVKRAGFGNFGYSFLMIEFIYILIKTLAGGLIHLGIYYDSY